MTVEFCRAPVHRGCSCVRPPGHIGAHNCLYRFPDLANETAAARWERSDLEPQWCPEVPDLICGRDHHDDCRRRALGAVAQARAEAP